jgi:Mor family transcriptional regulator
MVQCLEYFIFVMEGAGKRRKRVVLKIKAKIDICNRLERGKNFNKLMKEYGVESSTIYNIQKQKHKLL